MQRFAILNILGAALFAAWFADLLTPEIERYIILGGLTSLTLSALIAIPLRWRAWAGWVCENTTSIALIGTVYGLITALTTIDFSGSPVAILTNALNGLGIALGATLVGIISHVWLGMCLYVTRAGREG